jgi:hypothetical protein
LSEVQFKWTTEYPTKPGYYWIRNYAWKEDPDFVHEPDVVSVGAFFYFTGTDQPYHRDELAYAEWYGPIEAPE